MEKEKNGERGGVIKRMAKRMAKSDRKNGQENGQEGNKLQTDSMTLKCENKIPGNGAKNLLTHWQVYQIVTSSKVLGSPSVESTGTLFVLILMQTQFTSKR